MLRFSFSQISQRVSAMKYTRNKSSRTQLSSMKVAAVWNLFLSFLVFIQAWYARVLFRAPLPKSNEASFVNLGKKFGYKNTYRLHWLIFDIFNISLIDSVLMFSLRILKCFLQKILSRNRLKSMPLARLKILGEGRIWSFQNLFA